MNRRMLACTVAWMVVAAAAEVVSAAPKYDPATDRAGNMSGLETANGRVAYDFIDTWFNRNRPAEAFDRYVAKDGYLDHAVYGATTETRSHTFEQEKQAAIDVMRILGATPKFDTKQILAEGEIVFMHIAVTKGTPAPGASSPNSSPQPSSVGPPPGDRDAGIRGDHNGPREMIEILRVHKGKIYDHWDMHVATSSDSIVFSDLDRKLP